MSKEKRLSYSPNFKSSGIIYARENGNGTAEKNFGSPSIEKMIHYCHDQEQELKMCTVTY